MVQFSIKGERVMKFEEILEIIKSADSDYLKAARLFDATQLVEATKPHTSAHTPAKPSRKPRGPNKPKSPTAIAAPVNGAAEASHDHE
jgi:hypothetical protein